MKTLCFTGRRPQNLPWGFDETDQRCINLKKLLEEKIDAAIADGFTHFISGMALGVDMWAAEIVLSRKNAGCKITLEAALPHPRQSAGWSMAHKRRHQQILKACDKVTCVCDRFSYSCLMQRNCYMVDSSDRVIAVVSSQLTGGSGKTALYARSKGVPVDIINI